MMALGLVDRDPKKINAHIKCHFEDVLAEPDGAHSVECVWRHSRACFGRCLGCCYGLVSTLCGLCLAVHWAVQVASLVFCHAWCLTPGLRFVHLCLEGPGRFLGLGLHCCLDPVCQACGLVFRALGTSEDDRLTSVEFERQSGECEDGVEIRLDS